MAGLLSLVLAGAAVVPAAPIAARDWFTSKDHPKTAMRVVERGHVAYTIHVAPDGTALRCETPQQGDLDAKVCELVMKRARFTPATDAEGRPAHGTYEAAASFLMPGKERQRPDLAKLTLPLDRLPEGVTGPAYAHVAFTVDAAGTIGHCTAMPGERRRAMQVIEALAPEACAALARDYRPTPARNAAGEPVVSVQSALVRFEAPR